MYKYNTLEDINRKLKRMANTQIELKFARLEKTRSHTRKYAHAYDGWLAGWLFVCIQYFECSSSAELENALSKYE